MKLDALKKIIGNAMTFDVGDGCVRYICEYATKDSFDDIITCCAQNGFSVVQRRSAGENLFATLRSGDGDAVVSYFNYNHTIFIVTDEIVGRKHPPLEAGTCESVTAPKLGFLGLHSPEALNDGSGMGFVFTLCDGSFIIYDGGFLDDGEGLIEYLEAHNARDEKPRIAAWILTHPHGDHYFAMKRVAAKYADRLIVEDFVFNVRHTAYEFEQYEGYLAESFASNVFLRFEGAHIVRPHVGQLLCYRDAQIEILSTQEEILPSHFRWLNETSMITRVCLGGQSIFMPADSELGVEVMIPAIYGDELKSDFIQQAHHAFTGGSYILYDLVRPKVAFWTTNRVKYEKYCNPQYNNGYNYYLKNMVKENYNHSDGDIILKLPYEVN